LTSLPGTAWIRVSTGKLCVDVGDRYESCEDSVSHIRSWVPVELPEVKLTENDLGARLVCTLELDEFYYILARGTMDFPNSSLATPGIITLPLISYCDRAHFKPNEFRVIPIATHLTLNDLYIGSWHWCDLSPEVLPTGWTWCAHGCFGLLFANNRSVGLIIKSVQMKTLIRCRLS
jgi:hypothetical protein